MLETAAVLVKQSLFWSILVPYDQSSVKKARNTLVYMTAAW